MPFPRFFEQKKYIYILQLRYLFLLLHYCLSLFCRFFFFFHYFIFYFVLLSPLILFNKFQLYVKQFLHSLPSYLLRVLWNLYYFSALFLKLTSFRLFCYYGCASAPVCILYSQWIPGMIRTWRTAAKDEYAAIIML